MMTMRWFGAVVLAAAVAVPAARPQEFTPPKPGPEHEVLKKFEGTWEVTMKAGGMETRCMATNKMELGGMWLVTGLEGEFAGTKFYGKGLDSYDAASKKYVSVFVDSMSSRPLVMEGTYDKDKKTLTMAGEGPGMDGKPTKYKTVTTFTDDNTMTATMWMGGEKAEPCTFVYKRKK
jgi:hypothetical protein